MKDPKGRNEVQREEVGERTMTGRGDDRGVKDLKVNSKKVLEREREWKQVRVLWFYGVTRR